MDLPTEAACLSGVTLFFGAGAFSQLLMQGSEYLGHWNHLSLSASIG